MKKSTDNAMDLETFNDNLDRHGSSISSWPSEQRDAALELTRQSNEARQCLTRSEQLDSLLTGLPTPAAATDLHARILANVPVDRWSRLATWFNAALWRPVLAMGVALTFGFMLGLLQQPADWDATDQYLVDELSTLAFSPSFAELPYED